jgi:hypothetical protein
VARDTTSGASRGEKDENVTEKVDVRLEGRSLLLRELLLARVELKPIYLFVSIVTVVVDKWTDFLYCLISIGNALLTELCGASDMVVQ